jgi:hypothetical protein
MSSNKSGKNHLAIQVEAASQQDDVSQSINQSVAKKDLAKQVKAAQ